MGYQNRPALQDEYKHGLRMLSKYIIREYLRDKRGDMENILLINPPSAFSTYKGTKVDAYVQLYPLLSLPSLAVVLRAKGFSVSVLD